MIIEKFPIKDESYIEIPDNATPLYANVYTLKGAIEGDIYAIVPEEKGKSKVRKVFISEPGGAIDEEIKEYTFLNMSQDGYHFWFIWIEKEEEKEYYEVLDSSFTSAPSKRKDNFLVTADDSGLITGITPL